MQELQETQVGSLGGEGPLEEGMATHSSILAWRTPKDGGAWWATVHVFTDSRITAATQHAWTVACQAPLSMGFSQARILEWAVTSSSRGSSRLRDQTHVSHVSCMGRRDLYH